VVLIAVLSEKSVEGAILWGILGAAVLYYAMAGIGCIFSDAACQSVFEGITLDNPFNAFGEWGTDAAGKVFTEGFDFSGYTGTTGGLILVIVTTALSLCMIDMFDTIGTLYGACRQGGLLDEEGTPINMNKSMLSDAIATCAGALAGTSTVTTYVESSSGVAAGGRTGLTALVTAVCFILATFLSPIAQLIPGCATASALIWVGVLMCKGVTDIDWSDAAEAAVGFITFIVMCLGYSINKGIGAGLIAFVLVSVFTGKIKEVKISTWVVFALFVAMFVLT
ncbi:MAG: NCS2 family permease, partial [Clostridia bacterium]|nr:NCS2 family permease [Clostridia bacterium]